MRRIGAKRCHNIFRSRAHRFGVALIAVVAIVFIAGCTSTNSDYKELLRAESLVHSEPEEALEIVESISPDSFTSRSKYAHYALVYSEVCYYAGVRIESDTLTRAAMDYFSRRGDKNNRARAYFYHGQANYNMEQFTEAMWAFMEAEEVLEDIDNPYLEGLVHRAKGDIYGMGCLYRNGYDSYAASKECFQRAGATTDVAYADYDLGRLAMAKRNFEASEVSLTSAYDYALEHNDKDFLSLVIYHLGELYVQQGEYEKCAEALSLYEKSECDIYDPSHYYSLMAVIEATRGNIEAAHDNLSLAEGSEPRNEHLISYAQYSVHRIIGENDEALKWLEVTTQRQDKTILQVLEQPVLNYQIGQLQSTIESKEQKERLRLLLNISIYVSILLLILVMTIHTINRIKAKNRAIQHYMDSLHELQLTRGKGSEQLSEAVSQLYKDRLNDLNDLCETYYEHSDTSRHAAKVFEQVRRTIESIKSDEGRLNELESLVNKCRDNMMQKLREQCPKLNERELRVALYSYAGFSSRAICIFIESNPTALSKVKYRIKTKIKESGAPDAEILITAITDI